MKPGKTVEQIVLVRKGDVMALQIALKSEGFDVPAGSPGERIMRAAVKSGYAEEFPEDERWRRELLQARDAPRRDR